MYLVNKDALPRPTVTQDAKKFCRYSTNALAQYIVTVSHDTVRTGCLFTIRHEDRIDRSRRPHWPAVTAPLSPLSSTTRLHPLGNASRA